MCPFPPDGGALERLTGVPERDGTPEPDTGDLRALPSMLGCPEIHLLPGWEASVGARLELSVAAAVGMRVTFAGGA